MRRLLPLALLLAACGSDAPSSPDRRDTTDTAGTSDAGADVADVQSDPADIADAADPDSTDVVGPDPTEALEALTAALCPGYAAAWCAADCGCDDGPGFPDDCEAAFAASCAARLASYLPLLESGQAVVTLEGAATCLENFAPLAAACVPFPEDLFFFVCPILAPPGGFPPAAALGEACQGLCETGLRCGTEGKCVVPGDVGASCTSAYDCETTLVCVVDAESGEGETPTARCAAPRHADIGKSCQSSDDCAGDTGCLASSVRVCEARSSGACLYDEDCPTDAWCDTAGDEGQCMPGGASGEPCGNGIVCQAGLVCGAQSGVCGPFPVRGEPCALGRFGPFLCADGLTCLESLTCGDAPTEGEACGLGDFPCEAGLGCVFGPEGSTCQQKAEAGTYCENDDTCMDDLFCDFGSNTCTPFLARGELCTDGNECGPAGSCLPGLGFVFRCADKPGLGDACFLDDCEDGLVCRTPYDAGVCAPALCSMMRF